MLGEELVATLDLGGFFADFGAVFRGEERSLK